MSIRIEDCFARPQEAIQRLQSLVQIDQEYVHDDDTLSQKLHRWNEATFSVLDSEMSLGDKWELTIKGIDILARQILLDRDPVLVSILDGSSPMDRSVWEKISGSFPYVEEHKFAKAMIAWLSTLPQGLVPEISNGQDQMVIRTEREIVATIRADLADQEKYRMEAALRKMEEAFDESQARMTEMVEDFVDHHQSQVNALQSSFNRRFASEQETRKKETAVLLEDNDELHLQTSVLGEKVLDAQFKQAEFQHEIDLLGKTKVILSRQLDGAEKSVQNLNQKVDNLRHENCTLEGNLGAARSSIGSLQAQNGSLSNRISIAQASLQSQQNQISGLRQETAGLRRMNAQLRQAVDDMDDGGFCSIM